LPQEDTSKYPKCGDTKFKIDCDTYCNLSNVDSILIEKYQKGDNFQNLAKRNYYRITDKNLYVQQISRFGDVRRSWSFKLSDSLDANYDYRFIFQDNGGIKNYLLTELVIEPLPELKSNGANFVVYKCGLGSWKINGHTFYGGYFQFYY
jgi:hypothetical protein